MVRWFMRACMCAALVASSVAHGAPARDASSSGLTVHEHVLANGLRVLLIPRHITPTVSCAWVAHVGSANERPGITGISHLFEHMMFKGTHVIGTRDYAKDVALIAEQEAVQDSIRAELSLLRQRRRDGLIDDVASIDSRTPRMTQLEARFDALVAEQRANMVKNEFDLVTSRNGATGTNAFTNEDETVYFYTLPANKLELWFWMEADRLTNPVFREFYSERDVVYEERRRSVESTPTGKYDESFDAVFWDASPYSWPVIGWPSDVANITKAQADEYYSLFYQPQNITAVLVGDFDPAVALAYAKKYLGSIPPGARRPPEMITSETRQLAEKRFYGEAETNPGCTLRWHTVPYTHRDVAALEVLANIFNGPTGRLQRSVVLGGGPATQAASDQDQRKYEGMFEIIGEARDGKTGEDVERAILAEIAKLQSTPVAAEELQRVKNRYLASTYRQLVTNQQIMFRYANADGRGNWRQPEILDRAVQEVTAEDVQRVARRYFTRENRAVAIWSRTPSSEIGTTGKSQ